MTDALAWCPRQLNHPTTYYLFTQKHNLPCKRGFLLLDQAWQQILPTSSPTHVSTTKQDTRII